MKRLLGIFFILMLILNTPHANADGHGKAVVGTILGGALIGIGAASLVKDINTCSTPEMLNCWKIPLDILEIAGGGMAMMQNNTAANQTSPNGGPTFNPNINIPNMPNTPNTTIPNLPNTPNTQKPIVFGTDSNGNPSFQFPPKEELERLVQSGFENGTAPDGTSLNDALAKLNENYDKAKEAVASYNQQALSGGALPFSDFGSSSPSNSQLADSNNGTSSLGSDFLGLNKGTQLSSKDPYSGIDSNNSSDSNTLSPNATELNLDKIKKQRGESQPVKIIGLNTEDSNGRTLSIFERVTRAIRGDRNRDLTLAKIEWTRKAVLNKPKAPSILAPKVKLSASDKTQTSSTKTQI
jgi:hypothetical protein